ncbi:MAG: hypothetical protein WC352_00175 [Candidatus Omnitrophota bacterium]|jgi:hypothetical protein
MGRVVIEGPGEPFEDAAGEGEIGGRFVLLLALSAVCLTGTWALLLRAFFFAGA